MLPERVKLAGVLDQHQPADSKVLSRGRVLADGLRFQEQPANFSRAAFDRAAVDEDLGNVVLWRRIVHVESLTPDR